MAEKKEEGVNVESNQMEMDSDADDSDESWEEEDSEQEKTTCLFCEDTFGSVEKAIDHLKAKHDLDIIMLKKKFNMDQYSYIKLVNYIRHTKVSPETISKCTQPFWDDEKYLKPLSYETWLTFDFECYSPKGALSTKEDGDDSDDLILQNLQMKNMIRQLLQQSREKDDLLEQAATDMAKMRDSFNAFIEKEEKTNEKTLQENDETVGRLKGKADESYFDTYAHFGIHHEMLTDEVRTESYRDAILNNSEFMKGKTVLDLGCGTGILSMFASKAGAEKIVAIDNSEIIYHAMDIARRNGINNITFVKGKLEDTELPIEKFDIIISEWMGYFLLFEGMLDSIIYARRHHLKEGGMLVPNRCNISLVGYGDVDRHNNYIGFWKNVYGYNMECMQNEVLREAVVEVCQANYILTTSNIIANLNLMEVDYTYSSFSFDFKLPVIKPGMMTSFVGYFDTFFELPSKVSFSTSPENIPTHWKHVVFYIKNPVEVKVDDVITGKITCRRNRKDLRALKITIEAFNEVYNYDLN